MSNKTSAISLGPGASSLILIFVVLSMTVLGMLSLLTARNDRNMSVRSIRVIEAQYKLNRAAEEKRAEIDEILAQCRQDSDTQEAYIEKVVAALPDYVGFDGQDRLTFSVSDGSRTLLCRLQIHDIGSVQRASWLVHSLTAETGEESWN